MAKKKKTAKKKAKKKTSTKKPAAKKKAKKKAAAKKTSNKKKSAQTTLDAVEIAKKQRHIFLLKKVKDKKPLTKKEIAELTAFQNPPKKPEVSDHGTLFSSVAAAAKYAGVTTKTIYNWRTKNNMPMVGDKYASAFLDIMKAAGESKSTELHDRNKRLEGDLKSLKIRQLEMQIGALNGDLISREEVEAAQIAKVLAVKRALLGMGSKLAPKLKNKKIREMVKIIDDYAKHILRTFAGK